MKKVSTAAPKGSRKISPQKLTVGLDLGDRSSWYCVLDEAGGVLLERRVATTAKALQTVFGPCRGAALRWKPGCIRRGSAGC